MIWLAAYIACVPVANWAITTYGIVPIGFNLMAPAGVFAAGFALFFRDMVQETVGRDRWYVVPLAIGIGALLSLAVSAPFVALASAAAFLLSEVLDWGVYTGLRRRGLILALVVSNLFGLTLDSLAFLLIAFGNADFLVGQVVAKSYTLLPAIALMWTLRNIGYIGQPKMVAA